MRYALPGLLLIATAFFGLLAVSGSGEGRETGAVVRADSAAKVELGRRLFYDADLSINGTMSCATCHEQHHAFADGNRMHPGALGDPGRRNVPGLQNLASLSPLTWADPRQTTLEKQAAVPILGEHPVEMAMTGHEAEIPKRLGRDPCYRTMYRKAFPRGGGRIDYDNTVSAIAAFERTLVSRSSPWDRFAAGQADGLSAEARRGLEVFKRSCASCHAGKDFTDAKFHRIGAAGGDAGLAEVTASREDFGKFRTPSLRNVGVTAPYLHDGSAPTLADAIRVHDGISVSEPDLDALLAFLGSLTDHAFLTDPRLSLPMEACGKPL
ncbi:cytochrome c peroxidase [Novosphingobium sp. PhB165]|uniref:cytochrome-c peroxidase n=1 Tax=Novosphingobium sp. PhB165 TaxID=2485105 RepID=UPI00104AF1B6|nr:cytochrome c peroxidase [Novosphingobium sp. PhB165]TCM20453.1 cytochrome c peroxidase [Novosphingobium sp. PhB165]